jgi:anti-sigma B factor antagonist
MRIAIDTDTYPGRSVVTVTGEIDMLGAPRLRQILLGCLSESGADVVADLDGITFLASTGLGVLVEAGQHATARGSELRLVCASRAVLRPLELTGLNQVFEIHPDLTTLT